mmetsp:Transcript_46987/g.134402  ORF Transcript_46987/g.134402 Transcript_46987/m.134402 type:complete len:227 (+) Transcript_46987:429-1109(+)
MAAPPLEESDNPLCDEWQVRTLWRVRHALAQGVQAAGGLQQQHPEAPGVCQAGHVVLAKSHLRWNARQPAAWISRRLVALGDNSSPKIQQFAALCRVDGNMLHGDVSVAHVLRVAVGQGGEHLVEDVQGAVLGQSLPWHPCQRLRQVSLASSFEHEVDPMSAVHHINHLHDVRMVNESRQKHVLAVDVFNILRIRDRRLADDLDDPGLIFSVLRLQHRTADRWKVP